MKKILPWLSLVFLLAAMPVLAAGKMQVSTPPDVGNVVQLAAVAFASLAFFPAFVAALGNLLKLIHILPDGAAPTFNFAANLLAYIAVFVAILLGKGDLISAVDGYFQGITQLIVQIVILLGGSALSMGLTGKYHGLMKTALVPVFGYSHSKK